MKRRNFLKVITAGLVGASLPLPALGCVVGPSMTDAKVVCAMRHIFSNVTAANVLINTESFGMQVFATDDEMYAHWSICEVRLNSLRGSHRSAHDRIKSLIKTIKNSRDSRVLGTALEELRVMTLKWRL